MQNHSLPNRLPADLLPHSNQLNALARLSGLLQRAARKIFPADFLKAVLLTVIEEKPHYRGVATSIAEISSHRPSRQAVGKRLAMPEAAAFLFMVLGEVIARQSTRLVSADRHAGRGLESCRGRFNRVIDEDSTVTPLHPSLAKVFPGARNQHGQCAAIRQRWAYDYLSGQTLDALPGLWSENDPSAAFDLLPLLEENDLVLRDMGYFNLEALNRIDRRKAFYITRLPEGTVIADEQGERIALARLLRGCQGEASGNGGANRRGRRVVRPAGLPAGRPGQGEGKAASTQSAAASRGPRPDQRSIDALRLGGGGHQCAGGQTRRE